MIPETVLQRWGLVGKIDRLGHGRINDTFLVSQRYVVQRINDAVFRQPEAVVTNFRAVYGNVFDLVPQPLPTRYGEDFFVDESENLWRASVYFESRSFRRLPDSLCEAAGNAYGLFLARLKSFEPKLEPAILGFHDLDHYMSQLRGECSAELVEDELGQLGELLEEQSLTESLQQVIHGDCKINNLLFHPTAPRVLRIVDLDTVMYGNPAWDFGDLVRSLASGFDLDAIEHEKLGERIRHLCFGFFSYFRLAKGKRARVFARAPAHMALMLGVRYLTDHLQGDVYFKVEESGENLARARRQFKIAQRFRALETELEEYIEAAREIPSTTSKEF